MATNYKSWGGRGALSEAAAGKQHIRLCNKSGQRRVSVAARASSVVKGDVVLLFLCLSRLGWWCTLLVAKAEAKREVGANSGEVK